MLSLGGPTFKKSPIRVTAVKCVQPKNLIGLTYKLGQFNEKQIYVHYATQSLLQNWISIRYIKLSSLLSNTEERKTNSSN